MAIEIAIPISKGTGLSNSMFTLPLSEAEAKKQARLLKALADPTRLMILSVLSRYEDEVCVFEIVELFTLAQPTISHHIHILRDAGIVDYRKDGLQTYYFVCRDVIQRAGEHISALTGSEV